MSNKCLVALVLLFPIPGSTAVIAPERISALALLPVSVPTAAVLPAGPAAALPSFFAASIIPAAPEAAASAPVPAAAVRAAAVRAAAVPAAGVPAAAAPDLGPRQALISAHAALSSEGADRPAISAAFFSGAKADAGRADAVLLPDGGYYAGLQESLSARNYRIVRDGARAAVARARADGRTRLTLVVARERTEGWSEALLLNPQDPRAEAGIDKFLRRISNLQNTTHLDSVGILSVGPLSGRPMRSRSVLPKGGWYSGLNESLSAAHYRKVEASARAALARAVAAGDDVLALRIDRTRSEGYSELLLLDPRKPEQARDGLRLFLRGISNLQNTTYLDSVSILRPRRR